MNETMKASTLAGQAPSSEIEAALSRLSTAVNHAHDAAGRLESRIVTVLAPGDKDVPGAHPSPDTFSQFGAGLHGVAADVEVLVNRLLTLADRVQL